MQLAACLTRRMLRRTAICANLLPSWKKKGSCGEARRLFSEIDPVRDYGNYWTRDARWRSGALLFEKPKGSRMPLLINMLGSERRMNLALEVSNIDEVAARIRGFLDMQSPQGLLDKIKMLPKLAELGSFFRSSVKTGPCKEIVRRENFSLT